MTDVSTARVPKRVFRAGAVADLLLLGTPDGAWDDPTRIRGLHCHGSRRGAVLAAMVAGVSVDALWVQAVRVTDLRPYLVSNWTDDPAERQRLLASADDAGYAGVMATMAEAPTQRVWVLLDPAAVTALGPATRCSLHDPDVAAVRTLAVMRSRGNDQSHHGE